MEESMPGYGSASQGGITNRLSEMGSRVSDRVSEMSSRLTDTEPKSTPSTEHREGPVARAIEQQTARIPIHFYGPRLDP